MPQLQAKNHVLYFQNHEKLVWHTKHLRTVPLLEVGFLLMSFLSLSVTVSCHSSTLPSFVINHSSANLNWGPFVRILPNHHLGWHFYRQRTMALPCIAYIHHASFINFPSLPLPLFLPSFGAPLVIVASPWRHRLSFGNRAEVAWCGLVWGNWWDGLPFRADRMVP